MVTKRLFYRYPLQLIVLMFVAAGVVISCSDSQYHSDILSRAEEIAYHYPDSALALIEAIEEEALDQDSIKAKYYYVLASVHDGQDHVAL